MQYAPTERCPSDRAPLYSKLTTNKEYVAESSQAEAQEIIDCHAADGWRLASTDATSFGAAVYVYLYFERDAPGA